VTIATVLNHIFRPQAVLARRIADNPQAVIHAGKALVTVINQASHQVGINGPAARHALRRVNALAEGSSNLADARQTLRDVRILKHDLAAQMHDARKHLTGQPSWYADRLSQLRTLHQQAREVQHLKFDQIR